MLNPVLNRRPVNRTTMLATMVAGLAITLPLTMVTTAKGGPQARIAERPAPPLCEVLLRVLQRRAIGLGIPALGEIPDSLLSLPSDDGHLAARVQDAEHQPHLPLAPPAVSLARRRLVILDLAR